MLQQSAKIKKQRTPSLALCVQRLESMLFTYIPAKQLITPRHTVKVNID